MSSNKKEEILQIVKNTSVDLLDERKSIHDILLVCKNICKTLQISDKNTWLDLEINGYLIKYKTRDELYQNLPSYRKTDWKFYDLYGNPISLPPDIVNLFGKSTVYHSVNDLENKDQIIIGSQFLDKFNNFITNHGMDYASKNARIHEARITKMEISQVISGIKARIQELLDTIISILEY
ncbi:MAG: hypothetical protein ABI340_10925 [Nitrososphaera sp.]